MGESTQKVHGSSSLVRSTAIVDAVLACIASGISCTELLRLDDRQG
jgi:hypothetical protein